MRERLNLQKKIVRLLEKELQNSDPRVRDLIKTLLHQTHLNKNKAYAAAGLDAANKLQAEIEKIVEHGSEEQR